jgi:hypothetical protein
MAQRGIVPWHQILNNQELFVYQTKIEFTKMTCELVPPPMTTIATLPRRPSKGSKTTLSAGIKKVELRVRVGQNDFP